ncbi:hypothetical protein GCM10022252_35300 [Streptosporangium oxazolinicum]|uniref:Uncharacterized protein n=1 Tax=Streptosporangium oxazolinicum TaxID=909287 RepID=A0ABP8AXH3_9ACTN
MKATWRQVSAPRLPVLSYEVARKTNPSSGTSFHSLQATSQALHPMQMLVSVKKPYLCGATSVTGSPRMVSVQVAALTWENAEASLSGLPGSERDKPFGEPS